MRLSIYIFYERLSEWEPVLKVNTKSKKTFFIGAQIVDKYENLLPHHLLLGYSDYFNENNSFSGCGIISIGKLKGNILHQNSCICLPCDSDIRQVFHRVQQIFLKFNLWEENLTKSVYSNASLEDICTLCVPIFENPIFIHDEHSNILTSVNEMPKQFSWDYDSSTGQRSLPLDIMNDFKISEEYQQTMNSKGAQMFSAAQFGYRILYINLWLEESYLGRICISELGVDIKEGCYELLEHFAGNILASLQKGNLFSSDSSLDLKQSFIELLEHKKTNESLLADRLQSFGWHIDDSYFCISVFLEERDYSTYAINYTCNRLENTFPFCCIFLYQDCILIIANPRNSQITEENFFSKLAVFLREGLFKSGISSLGYDFRLISYYYIQTIAAYRLGSQKDPMSWKYNFNDYMLPYFFEQASKELKPLMLCEPNLLELYKYDQKHQTEYFRTLKIYLEKERNAVHTADLLFIHRSTLFYRLNKIKSLINVDIENPQVRLHLMISYELFKYK